ncbi:MAG: gliding motility-associated ABC transporter permease subunit GldF, partial [Bacteroidetes bacterium]|nr:gliding motility-associated ABC transporter permease subunit GldF [Bacteroidota bacterium]
SKNQVTAFLIGVLLCYLFYNAFYQLSQLDAFVGKWDYIIQSFGMGAHYEALSRGVIDTRDLVYFLSVIVVFTLLSKISLESRKW